MQQVLGRVGFLHLNADRRCRRAIFFSRSDFWSAEDPVAGEPSTTSGHPARRCPTTSLRWMRRTGTGLPWQRTDNVAEAGRARRHVREFAAEGVGQPDRLDDVAGGSRYPRRGAAARPGSSSTRAAADVPADGRTAGARDTSAVTRVETQTIVGPRNPGRRGLAFRQPSSCFCGMKLEGICRQLRPTRRGTTAMQAKALFGGGAGLLAGGARLSCGLLGAARRRAPRAPTPWRRGSRRPMR